MALLAPIYTLVFHVTVTVFSNFRCSFNEVLKKRENCQLDLIKIKIRRHEKKRKRYKYSTVGSMHLKNNCKVCYAKHGLSHRQMASAKAQVVGGIPSCF